MSIVAEQASPTRRERVLAEWTASPKADLLSGLVVALALIPEAISFSIINSFLMVIFERIREELRLGKTPGSAVDAGYGRAFWTIFDAQITTLIAGVVMNAVDIEAAGDGPLQVTASAYGGDTRVVYEIAAAGCPVITFIANAVVPDPAARISSK